MRKILIIVPVEERFNESVGGAIFRWVTEVYTRYDSDNVTILSKKEVFSCKLNYSTSICFDFLMLLVSLLSNLFSIDRKKITRFLSIKGILYLLLNRRLINSSDILHIHNRPKYVKVIRFLGYKGKIILHMHNDIDNYASKKLLSNLGKSVDLFLFCSLYLKNKAQNSLTPNSKCRAIYNGVELEKKDLGKSKNKNNDGLTLLHAGRLIPEKGALEAIAIVENLNKRGVICKLLLVGAPDFGVNTNTSYSSLVKERIEKVNSSFDSNVIKSYGHLPHQDLLLLMSSSSLFIYPCLWDEPFGMVVIEAMSRATPVVSLRKGGIPEIITNGVDGYICNNVLEMENIIIDIFNNDNCNYLSYNAKVKVEEKFTWDLISKEMKFMVNTL